ncbi:MAG: ATP-binding protein [Pseudomonadota bacterium]
MFALRPNTFETASQPMADPRFALLDEMHDLVLVLDQDRRVVFVNRGANARLGAMHLGRPFVQVIRNPTVLELLDKVEEGLASAADTVTLRTPVPGTFRIRVSRSDDEGTPFIVVAMLDISEQRAAEQMRSDFVANVSHELRSPLTAMSGFIETLQGPARDDPDAHERFLNLMHDETGRMTRLIQDLLHLSRVEERQASRPTGEVDLTSVLGRARAVVQQRADASEKSINFDIPADLPTIRGDTDELVQLFQNLLENAVKYSAPGTAIDVTVTPETKTPGIATPTVTITVSDQGEGISREHLPRLTERFYRVDDHRGRKSGGTGLGLAIVKHVVQRHRGRLNIGSEVGKGSSFKIHLPMQD